MTSVIAPPEQPKNIPDNSKWLAGEGAGSWFSIKQIGEKFKITRFSPNGKIECSGSFNCNKVSFDIDKDFRLDYPSHCKLVTICQFDKQFIFTNER